MAPPPLLLFGIEFRAMRVLTCPRSMVHCGGQQPKRSELVDIQDAPTYGEILADPSTRDYVKEVIRLVRDRDPVDVANDMDVVAKAAARRADGV